MKKQFTSIAASVLFLFSIATCYAQIPLPRPAQIAWQEAELGVVFHYDLHVFDGKKYNQANNRTSSIADYNIFNPEKLNTDQWVLAAKAAGAKFAILTATHETGFALYQSDVNPYCMKALKWKNGQGDILRDFVNSCRKYGIKPGVYLGIRWNARLGIYDFKVQGEGKFAENRQQAYKKMCEGMVEEITTRYGDLFMIWFDGGASNPKTYGADVLPIVEKNQPNCLFYHNAQRADFRWGGSESGTVPYPCWGTFPFAFSHAEKQEVVFKNDFQLLKEGDPNGKYYVPAMSDAPLRGYKGRHEWFWEPGDETHVFPVPSLIDMYLKSVGHNSTLILGLTPDATGLLPQPDVDTLAAFGKKINELFGNPIASLGSSKNKFEIKIPKGKEIERIIIQEDISKGQRVRAFDVLGYRNGRWETVVKGTSIGHKFIGLLPTATSYTKMKLVITESTGQPFIKQFTLY